MKILFFKYKITHEDKEMQLACQKLFMDEIIHIHAKHMLTVPCCCFQLLTQNGVFVFCHLVVSFSFSVCYTSPSDVQQFQTSSSLDLLYKVKAAH